MSLAKFKFEPELLYQRDAIDSVANLFEGMPLSSNQYSVITPTTSQRQVQTEFGGIKNPELPVGFEGQLLNNLNKAQIDNNITQSEDLEGLNFTVEMETGTGKTYVYLRTIFDLQRRYEFLKFIVLVPSIAIREGVMAQIELMNEHLQSLYQTPFRAKVYDSKNLSDLKEFESSNILQILIMNIDALNKESNLINLPNDDMSGYSPIEYIRSCSPVLILDEPQNMESEKSLETISNLNPLCVLRYSATHKKLYNQVYRLGPVEAHEQELVKSIDVASVLEDANVNTTYVELLKIDRPKQRAQLRINMGAGLSAKQKSCWVKSGSDLFELSKGREEYKTGYIVDNIYLRSGEEKVVFTGRHVVEIDQPIGGYGDEVRRAQIKITIEQHLEKERQLAGSNESIKVLSLIFIDKVDNYRLYTVDGDKPGQYAEWFEEIYEEVRTHSFPDLTLPNPIDAHNGYFSKDSKGRLKDTRGSSNSDVTTYDLIMRDKERLLSTDEPLRFIFTHSALREGWDNPNVFQICTLNRAKSHDRRRQEIGRGLRLSVKGSGERVRDKQINRLTVIASEAYEDFAAALQTEYEEDTGRDFGVIPRDAFTGIQLPQAKIKIEELDAPATEVTIADSRAIYDALNKGGIINEEGHITDAFSPEDSDFTLSLPERFKIIDLEIVDRIERYRNPLRVRNARDRKKINFQKHVMLNNEFVDLWGKISKKTNYRVKIDTSKLIAEISEELHNAAPIEPVKILTQIAELKHEHSGIEVEAVSTSRQTDTSTPPFLPDILADLQNETDLTRKTICEILQRSNRLRDFLINPQEFLNLIVSTAKKVMNNQLLPGIQYKEIAGQKWEVSLLDTDTGVDLERYLDRLYEVQNIDKTPYDYVEFDSQVEKCFAKALDANRDVKFFVKLPAWFKVATPLGSYNPDWAVMFKESGGSKLYLIYETKSTTNIDELHAAEKYKVMCGEKHFEAIDVDYEVLTRLDESKKLRELYGTS